MIRADRIDSTKSLAMSVLLAIAAPGVCACSSSVPAQATSRDGSVSVGQGGGPDATVTVIPLDALAPDADALPPPNTFCSLPGSIVATSSGEVIMPGAPEGPDGAAPEDLTWLTVPTGFCAHYYANVPHVRQFRFAPGGDLFAASPSTGTAGGQAALPQVGGLVVLPDDDQDGTADSVLPFLTLASIQGMAFAAGSLYFQDDTTFWMIPFTSGQRTLPDAAPWTMYFQLDSTVAMQAPEHWPKVIDVAQDGTMYVTNGGTQSQECLSTEPLFGAIFKASSLQAGATLSEVARGFRNPIALRCEADHDVCLAVELSLDGSGSEGGREKIVPVRQGDDWGFPCCATQYLPFTGETYVDTQQAVTTSDCAGVSAENVAFIIGHTPFGLDFETGRWPAPWTDRAFVTLHGDVGSWIGARVVAIALDPQTGLPLPASELDAAATGTNLLDFANGWDDNMRDHGRPAPIAFAPDGRLFVGNDWTGDIVWMAPIDLPMP